MGFGIWLKHHGKFWNLTRRSVMFATKKISPKLRKPRFFQLIVYPFFFNDFFPLRPPTPSMFKFVVVILCSFLVPLSHLHGWIMKGPVSSKNWTFWTKKADLKTHLDLFGPKTTLRPFWTKYQPIWNCWQAPGITLRVGLWHKSHRKLTENVVIVLTGQAFLLRNYTKHYSC